jgi:hypothetical protein
MRRFQKTQYLALPERAELAANLGLTQTQGKDSELFGQYRQKCPIFFEIYITNPLWASLMTSFS